MEMKTAVGSCSGFHFEGDLEQEVRKELELLRLSHSPDTI